MKSPSILITGAAGFIGFHLSRKLCKRGSSIIGIDNLNDYYDVELKKSRLSILESKENFSFVKMDIIDRPKLVELFRDNNIQSIVHLAAQAGVRYSIENPQAYIDTNVTGFLNILEICREFKLPYLVYASSSSVYGANRKLPFSELDVTDSPLSLYGATKKTNELMAYTYSHLFGFSTIGLRFFTVYGPWGRPDMALFKFTKAIINQIPMEVYNHGKHSRSFTYIDDIIESICCLMKKMDKMHKEFGKNTIFNIGGSQSVELMDYIHSIEEYIGKKAIIEYLPIQPGDVEKTEADTQALESFIDYSPQFTIEYGIPKFIDWYREYYQI